MSLLDRNCYTLFQTACQHQYAISSVNSVQIPLKVIVAKLIEAT